MITGGYDYAIMKGGRFSFGEVEIQGLGAFAEDLLAQGVGGEETIAAGMPVSRVAGVGGIIDDDYAEGVVLLFPIEHAPFSTGGPGAVARSAFAGEVISVDVGGVAGSHFGYVTFVIDKFAGGVAGYLQLFGDAKTEQAVFGIREFHIGVCRKGREAVDDPLVGCGVKDIGGMFGEQRGTGLVCPAGVEGE